MRSSKPSVLLLCTLLILLGCESDPFHAKLKRLPDFAQEKYRPLIHFSPKNNWMNDPNGMVYYDGEYHLFYQYYPDSTVWGPMHWGHAISTDLVHWEELPIALYPDDLGYIFSGSAVIDWNNTSGLQKGDHPPMIAIFTHHDPKGEKEEGNITFQYQSIAYSNDKGRTWSKYEGNPVIPNPGIRDFRDPKVFWHKETGKWIMILAAADKVMLYSSTNLKEWAFESDFGENAGSHGGVWECPDLFKLKLEDTEEEKWVMLVSIGSGGKNGGSATQYFIGDFDGKSFTPSNDMTKPLWLDYGRDNYAGVTWSDIPQEDDRRIFIGWMSNWQYAQVVPTENWRSAMTLPRSLHLIKSFDQYRVASRPVKELKLLETGIPIEAGGFDVQDNEFFWLSQGGTSQGDVSQQVPYWAEVTFDLEDIAGKFFGVEFRNSAGEKYYVVILDGVILSDRTKIPLHKEIPDFADSTHRALIQNFSDRKELKLEFYVDQSSIEIFVADGEVVLTETLFASEPFHDALIFALNGKVEFKSKKARQLKSIWEPIK